MEIVNLSNEMELRGYKIRPNVIEYGGNQYAAHYVFFGLVPKLGKEIDLKKLGFTVYASKPPEELPNWRIINMLDGKVLAKSEKISLKLLNNPSVQLSRNRTTPGEGDYIDAPGIYPPKRSALMEARAHEFKCVPLCLQYLEEKTYSAPPSAELSIEIRKLPFVIGSRNAITLYAKVYSEDGQKYILKEYDTKKDKLGKEIEQYK